MSHARDTSGGRVRSARYGRWMPPVYRTRQNPDGSLPAECYCSRTIVDVPPKEVQAGRTRSCGPGCYAGCPLLKPIGRGRPLGYKVKR